MMEKVVKIVSIKDKQSDYDFWQSKDFKDRLEAIEMLRSQYIKFNSNVQPRLQRFCRVINQALS